MSAAGTVTVGTGIDNNNRVAWAPPVAYLGLGLTPKWHLGLTSHGASGNILQSVSNGVFELWINDDDDNDIPMNSFGNWNNVTASSSERFNFMIAASPASSVGYVFYAVSGSTEP
ncbi:MAG: hypothetical protein ABI895_38145 [Deltaproteobacteria bacterium]